METLGTELDVESAVAFLRAWDVGPESVKPRPRLAKDKEMAANLVRCMDELGAAPGLDVLDRVVRRNERSTKLTHFTKEWERAALFAVFEVWAYAWWCLGAPEDWPTGLLKTVKEELEERQPVEEAISLEAFGALGPAQRYGVLPKPPSFRVAFSHIEWELASTPPEKISPQMWGRADASAQATAQLLRRLDLVAVTDSALALFWLDFWRAVNEHWRLAPCRVDGCSRVALGRGHSSRDCWYHRPGDDWDKAKSEAFKRKLRRDPSTNRDAWEAKYAARGRGKRG